MTRLKEINSPYVADVNWLAEQCDKGAFVSMADYFDRIIGDRDAETKINQKNAVTLEISALQFFPWLIAEAGSESSSIVLQLRHLSGDLPAGGPSGAAAIPLRALGLLGGQIGLLTPLVALVVAALALGRRPLASGWRVSLSLLLLPVLATLLASLFVHAEQNWAAVGHPLAAVLALVVLPRRPVMA